MSPNIDQVQIPTESTPDADVLTPSSSDINIFEEGAANCAKTIQRNPMVYSLIFIAQRKIWSRNY